MLSVGVNGGRVPTEKQFHKLLCLGSGAIALAPGRRDWKPLLTHGWVEAISEDDGHRGFLPPLRITPAGLHALGAAVERYGLGEPFEKYKHLPEPPAITKLKAELQEAKDTARANEREHWQAQRTLGLIRRLLDGTA